MANYKRNTPGCGSVPGCNCNTVIIPTVTTCAIPAQDLTLTWYAYNSTVICASGTADQTNAGTPYLGPRTETLTYHPNATFPEHGSWQTPVLFFTSGDGYGADCGFCQYYQFVFQCLNSGLDLQFINGGAVDQFGVIIQGFASCNVNGNHFAGTQTGTGTAYSASFARDPSATSWTGSGYEAFVHGIISL